MSTYGLTRLQKENEGLKLWACQSCKICRFLQYQSAQDNSLLNRIFSLCNYFSVWVHRENNASTRVFCHFFPSFSILQFIDYFCQLVINFFLCPIGWATHCIECNMILYFLLNLTAFQCTIKYISFQYKMNWQ